MDTIPLNSTIVGPRLGSLLWSSRLPDQPSAWHGHIAFAHWLVDATRPHCIVELGTERGVSYTAMCHAVAALKLSTRCYAVDTWQGDAHTGGYDDSIYNGLKAFNDTHYSGFSTLLRCTFDAALQQFDAGSIDVLHIDGLHTYAAVRHDFETWLPKMSDRGVVIFHDTAIRYGDFGVWQFWEEFQARYPSFSFEHSAGLGMLAVGSSPPPAVAALCQVSGADEVATLRTMFAAFSEAAYHNGMREREALALRQRVIALETAARSAVERGAAASAQQTAEANQAAATMINEAGKTMAAQLKAAVEEAGQNLLIKIQTTTVKTERASVLAIRAVWIMIGIAVVAIAGVSGLMIVHFGHG